MQGVSRPHIPAEQLLHICKGMLLFSVDWSNSREQWASRAYNSLLCSAGIWKNIMTIK